MPRITEIFHDTRLKILQLIRFKPQVLANIAKDMNLSKPEISRHLSRLREQGLVAKDDNTYTISDLGELILKIISPLNIIFEHYEFFQTHTLIDLPLHIIRDLDALANSELMVGTGYILSKMEEISQIPTKEIKIISNEPFPDYRTQIVPSAYFILPSRIKPKVKYKEMMIQKYTSFNVRTLSVINYPLGIIDNKYGFLFFPDLGGRVDYSYTFYTTDPLCIEFMTKIWDYYWEISTPYLKSED